jgi:predicted PurR-regulated permease PerM
MVMLVIHILCIGLVFWLLWFLNGKYTPASLKDLINTILIVLFILIVIVFLLTVVGPMIASGFGHPYYRR